MNPPLSRITATPAAVPASRHGGCPRGLTTLLLLAACACVACSGKPLAPAPGPMYSTAHVRGEHEAKEPDRFSLAGAADLRSRTRISLGEIEYDGLVLPVLDPAARFIATQTSPAPTWETLLAQPGAPQPASRVKILTIDPAANRCAELHALPRGILLGRGATERGVLVEQAATTTSARRIGLADWRTGEIEWLTSGDADCAFAAIGEDGTLAYCRRGRGEDHWSLVLRDTHGAEHVAGLDDASIVFPQVCVTNHGVCVFAVVVAEAATAPMRLAAFMLSAGEPGLRFMKDAVIAHSGSMYEAFQAVAASDPLACKASSEEPLVMAFAAMHDAVAVFSLAEDRPQLLVRPCVPGTFAGCIATGEAGRPGVIGCTMTASVYQDLGVLGAAQSSYTAAEIWPRAAIFRRTRSSEWPYALVFVPTSAQEPLLKLEFMQPSAGGGGRQFGK